MKFSLVIHCSPAKSGAFTALNFAETLLTQNHTIYRIFLSGDGVLNGTAFSQSPQKENNLPLLWQDFIEKYQVDMVACISASLKRGIIDEIEARRYQKEGTNLLKGIRLGGLGEYVDALKFSDRIICFGV